MADDHRAIDSSSSSQGSSPQPLPGAVVTAAGRCADVRLMRSVSVRITTSARADWDALVDSTPGTDVTQLTSWARVREQAGFTPLYVFAERGGRLVGGAQVLVRKLPVVRNVGYVSYGPLVTADDPDRAAVHTALADALADVARRMGGALFVQPAEDTPMVSSDLLARGFRRSTADIAPTGSLRIDLTEGLDVIRGRFGRRLRSWTNRWADRGVVVRRGDEGDLPLLCELMQHTAAAQGHRMLSPEYVETLYRELAPDHAALFVGELDGTPLAADLVTRCAGMLRGRLSGFDRSGPAARVSLPAAIRWEIVQWGKKEGCHWLDFGGLTTATLDTLLAGGPRPCDGWPAADQPKLTFGGTAFRYPPAVELISSPLLRAGLGLANRSPRGRAALDHAAKLLRSGRSALPRPGGRR